MRTDQVIWNALTAAVLLITGTLYLIGVRRLAARQPIPPWRALAFFTGWSSVMIALLSKIDRLSDIFFSAHMAQHEILMLIAAPLMVIGRPFVAMLWAFSPEHRARIADQIRRPIVGKVWERITGPFTVLILHAVVLWAWHVPSMFEAALHNETIHVIQHLGFFITAALFFWALIHGRYGRLGYGAGFIYVFATAMHSQILGALLTFGRRTWYPTHAMRTGMHALDDQQLAGIVMWVPFGIIFAVIGLVLFAAWLGEVERRVALTTADELTGGAPRA